MQATSKRYGKVTIKERTDSTVTIVLEDGSEKRIIPAFIKLFDLEGNEISDFSSIQLNNPHVIGKSTSGRKTSRLAEIIGAKEELTGERFNLRNHIANKQTVK